MLAVYVLKNGVGQYNIFFSFFSQSLLYPPFCVVFCVESVNSCVCAICFSFRKQEHFYLNFP